MCNEFPTATKRAMSDLSASGLLVKAAPVPASILQGGGHEQASARRDA
jgi:hypothetical protein